MVNVKKRNDIVYCNGTKCGQKVPADAKQLMANFNAKFMKLDENINILLRR